MSRKFAITAAAGLGLAAGYYYYGKHAPLAPAISTFQDPSQWKDLKLKSFKDVSHDSREFTFALPSENHVSGLETASLLLAKFINKNGNPVIRPYTPVSTDDHRGEVIFVIKKYPNSKFGSHVFGLSENDTVSFKGPIQKWKWVPNVYDSITLIGGGSGITPLFQLLQKVANDPTDNTKVHLIYGSQSTNDILLKNEIDSLVAKKPNNLKVDYFVDKVEGATTETVHQGYISKDFLKSSIPSPNDKTHVFVCGPAGLYKAISGPKASKTDQGEVTGALADLGYTKNEVFKF